MRKQRVILEHHADAALVRRDVIDRPTAKLDVAMCRRLEPRQHHQAGCFSRARWPKHGDKFTSGNIEIEVFDNERFAVITLLNIFETNKRIAAVEHNVTAVK